MQPGKTIAAAVGVLVLILSLSGCGEAKSGSPTIGSAGAGPRHTLTKAVLFDFDESSSALSAGARIPSGLSNGPRGEVVMAGKGAQPLQLVTGRDGTGHAVAFPAHCPPEQGKTCPKQIIEVYPDTSIAPLNDDLEWGASVRLERSETAKGSNIIQKGFSLGGGSQWKLQVDGEKGHPSCVVVGVDQTEIHEVTAEVTVADGVWHDVVCKRAGDELVISVDGSRKKSVLVPADLTIAPPGPVRIGGKDVKPDNDQYFGALDDVYVAMR